MKQDNEFSEDIRTPCFHSDHSKDCFDFWPIFFFNKHTQRKR